MVLIGLSLAILLSQLGTNRAMPRDRLTMSGYWKKGETDFRDAKGDQ